MRTYLSVDVDYWAPFDLEDSVKEMNRFFQRIINRKVPIYIVLNHHQLLLDINQRIFKKLINVDYHSDITDFIDVGSEICECQTPSKLGNLNCGTWVNFVDERILGEFLWLYPRGDCIEGHHEGRCEDVKGFWDKPQSEFHNWNWIEHKKGLNHIRWRDVQAVGISLSPDWCYAELADYFIDHICPKLLQVGAVLDSEYKSYVKDLLVFREKLDSF